MLKAVIFDMDGVIVDTEPLSYKASDALLKKYGKGSYNEEFHRSVMGNSMMEEIRKIKEYFDLSDSCENIFKERNIIYKDIVNKEMKVMNGLSDLLEYLKISGIKSAVVTGSNRDIAEFILDKLGILSYFEFIIAGDEVEKCKPDPWAYKIAMKKLESTSDETIILEDSINGIKAAIAAGCKVIAVNSIWEEKGTKEILSFEEDLSNVKNIIENFK
ncbi:HAD-IA family hydrolase [Clostridium bovifaecis]|uniref:HAD-IA family hydrolase n=1 Tax=Clostridium bovifaecis TaxID=2184719 RepID=A0A6I6EP48_9CLOT|nr:HAD-IA family hydrolase [Clostridium bovifaecis]